MAGKRSATTDLNHENWDQKEEAEAAGTFTKASDDVLQKRVIKSAKRRMASTADDSKTKQVFSNFTGFSKTPMSSNTSTFNFLSNPEVAAVTKPNGFTTSGSIFSLKEKTDTSNTVLVSEIETKSNIEATVVFDKSKEYYAKLKGLNESVSQWIKTHVDRNPLCILTPIFKDYERYLHEIEKKEPSPALKLSDEANKTPTSDFKSITTESSKLFTFGTNTSENNVLKGSPDNKTDTAVASKSLSPFFSTDVKLDETQNKDKPNGPFVTPFGNTAAFSFSSSTATSSSKPFTFNAEQKFSFSNVTSPATENKDTEEVDNDEPPKVDITPIVEEGSVYDIKCKIFAKKGNEFVERGLGHLYIKPVQDSEKTQLIVRANTSLGNLLINLILSKSIPTSKRGKNNVMICVPTGEPNTPPTTTLIKVKTPEDADKLLAMLEKHKK